MAYINFQSRRDGKKFIHFNMLEDSASQDDELSGFYTGDFIVLNLDIEEEFVKFIKSNNQWTGMLKKNLYQFDEEKTSYVAEIEFKIVKRSHLVMRDWMTNQHGFRSSGTVIVVEAVSDEAEELFLELQKYFDARTGHIL